MLQLMLKKKHFRYYFLKGTKKNIAVVNILLGTVQSSVVVCRQVKLDLTITWFKNLEKLV